MTLLDEIKEKYEFEFLSYSEIKGHSSTIRLNRYFYEIQENEDIEPLRINIREVHDGGEVVEDCFRLQIVNCAENDEPHDLFVFYTFEKIHNFIQAILA